MADPILHIKDCYFFELPKVMVRYHYTDSTQFRKEFPFFTAEMYQEAEHLSADELNREMDGKIMIPQPFARLKNFYDKESGFAISKFMVLEFLAAAVLVAIFVSVARRLSSGKAPRGKFSNFFEGILLFVRDEIAISSMGEHDGKRFTPLLWTLFFFILTCNLLGLVPFLGTPTGAWGATLGLALVTFLTGLVMGIKQFGPIGYWLNQLPHMDLPVWLTPLKPLILLLEVVGLWIRHAVLSIRLLANMLAGHLVLLSILGLVVLAAGNVAMLAGVSVVCVVGSALLSLLELLVAFLQAYVFTILSALFIRASVHHH